MKRILLVITAAVAIALAPATASAETGIGIQFGEPGNVGLSLRFDRIAIGASWGFGDNGYLYVDADYWLLKNNIAKQLDWYLGLGAGIGLGDPFRLAARVPVGLQWMPAKNIEIFGQIVPGLKIIDKTGFYLGAAVGVRVIL
jgi:hypothetical protein